MDRVTWGHGDEETRGRGDAGTGGAVATSAADCAPGTVFRKPNAESRTPGVLPPQSLDLGSPGEAGWRRRAAPRPAPSG